MKEDYAVVLDLLPNGYPLERKLMPIIQAIGKENFTLLELTPRKEAHIEIGEEVYIGEGKREKIYYILGRLKRERLTETAKSRLKEIISERVRKNETEMVKFFNESAAINKRMHQIELLAGFGKKHMREILKQREEKLFESFKEIKERVPNLPDPEKAIEKRIFQEMTELEKYNLFTA